MWTVAKTRGDVPIESESKHEDPAVKPQRTGSVQLYKFLKLAPQFSFQIGPSIKEKLPGIKTRLRKTGITEEHRMSR